MPSLRNETARNSLIQRLQKLAPAAKPRWGKLDAPRLLCHLGDALSAACAAYSLHASHMALVHARTGSLKEKHSARQPYWPFAPLSWEQASMRRNTVKGTALNLAELSRQIRADIP